MADGEEMTLGSVPGDSLDGGTEGGGYEEPTTDGDNTTVNADPDAQAQPQGVDPENDLENTAANQGGDNQRQGGEGRQTTSEQGGQEATPGSGDVWNSLSPAHRSALQSRDIGPDEVENLGREKAMAFAQKVKAARDKVSQELGQMGQRVLAGQQGQGQGQPRTPNGQTPAGQPGMANRVQPGNQPGTQPGNPNTAAGAGPMGNQPQPGQQPQQPGQNTQTQGQGGDQGSPDVDIPDEAIDQVRSMVGDEAADALETLQEGVSSLDQRMRKTQPTVEELYQRTMQREQQQKVREADKVLRELASEDEHMAEVLGTAPMSQLPQHSQAYQKRQELIDFAGNIAAARNQQGQPVTIREAVNRAYSVKRDEMAPQGTQSRQGGGGQRGGGQGGMHRPTNREEAPQAENPDEKAAQAADEALEQHGLK